MDKRQSNNGGIQGSSGADDTPAGTLNANDNQTIQPGSLDKYQQTVANHQNYQTWLQLQHLISTNQQHQMAGSFYCPDQLVANEPLDLSLPKP
jgi:hypothetical protein